MQTYKKYLGMVIDGMVIESIEQYYDLSSDKVEYAFVIKDYSMGINCDLFISEYVSK